MQHMKDPAAGVPPQLLPHMHLVSKYRYPHINSMSMETVVGYLTEAPKIVRDLQPVQWQFLDAPQDGSVFLVWQPIEYLDTNFASDGYAWADVEHSFQQEARGYTLEVFVYRSGFKYPNEPVACHSRRRYRLLPSKIPNNLPAPDPSLFIVHYTRAERRESIASQSISIFPPVQASMNQRRFLQSQGQLARKEFMLHDRSNWPSINLPAAQPQFSHMQSLPGNIPRPQPNMINSQQPMMGQLGPASNRTAPGHGRGRSVTMIPDVSIEEEEDVSRGDMLDFMTPRDISKMRYEQHHEWMEEIMNSPYATRQIIPTDLGLGRKGELEALTSGFFETPLTNGDSTSTRVGRLDPGKADEFTKLAAQKVADMQAELEKMKQTHARRMAKLRKTTILNSAEKRLRTAPNRAAPSSMMDGQDESSPDKSRESVDGIIQDVELVWGKKIEPTSNVTCVQKGGVEEKAATNGPTSSIEPERAESSKRDIGSEEDHPSASNQLTGSTNTPGQQDPDANSNFSPQMEPNPGTPSADNAEREDSETVGPVQDEDEEQDQPNAPSLDDMDVDIEMAGLDEEDPIPESGSGEGNEWVMVNEQEGGDENASGQDLEELRSPTPQEESANTPTVFENTPTSAAQSVTMANRSDSNTLGPSDNNAMETEGFHITGDDFDNVDVDTAGDALADYGAEDDDLNEDLNLDTLDDSAFGDAFHPPEDTNPMDQPEFS